MENKELQTVYDEVFSGTEQFFTTDCEEERETIFRAMNWTGKRVLEIGCGTGDLAIRIFQAGAACVHGIDFSESAVISANEKADQFLTETDRHRFEVKNVDFDKIVESGQIVNFFDEDAYDVVVMQGVLEHFTSPPSSIKYIMKNLLRPDGVFLNSSPSFLNLRGVIWHTMLILFKAPMSLTDRFFLDVVGMEKILSFYGDVEIIPIYQDWGCGDLLIHDFKKRIKNVLWDMGDNDVNKVNAFMEWLERMVQYKDMLFKETIYTGAATLYKVYRMG